MFLVEERIILGNFEFGLQLEAVSWRGVRVATRTGHIELIKVFEFVAWMAPVALAATVLLRLCGGGTFKAVFGKELGVLVFGHERGYFGVVVRDIVGFGCASHIGCVNFGVLWKSGWDSIDGVEDRNVYFRDFKVPNGSCTKFSKLV